MVTSDKETWLDLRATLEDLSGPFLTLSSSHFSPSLYSFRVIPGAKTEIKNHYRGHKLSMWLNLIPQLHASGDPELPMRHHHFQEESAQFYDGM